MREDELCDTARDCGFARVEIPTLGPLLRGGIDRLIHADAYLLTHGASERAVCHRLAFHLEAELVALGFHEVLVDCEYNLLATAEGLVRQKRGESGRVVFPDIVVHERGVQEHNLLAVEAKVLRNANNANVESDLRRLRYFAEPAGPFGYQAVAFVVFGVRDLPVAIFECSELSDSCGRI